MNIIVKIILLICGIVLILLFLAISAFCCLFAVGDAILCGISDGIENINCNGCEDFWTSGS